MLVSIWTVSFGTFYTWCILVLLYLYSISLYISVNYNIFVSCSAMHFGTTVPSSGMHVGFTCCIACMLLKLIAIETLTEIKLNLKLSFGCRCLWCLAFFVVEPMLSLVYCMWCVLKFYSLLLLEVEWLVRCMLVLNWLCCGLSCGWWNSTRYIIQDILNIIVKKQVWWQGVQAFSKQWTVSEKAVWWEDAQTIA